MPEDRFTFPILASGIRLLTMTAVFGVCAARSLAQSGSTYDPQPTSLPKPEVTTIASPNYNARTAAAVDSIVIHTTEETLADTIDIFLDPARQVSAHFVIAPNGDVYQMVDTRNRAWHATYYNHRSIGIEMVGYASQASTWNPENLSSLTELLAWLLQAYPSIPLAHPPGDAYDYRDDAYRGTGLIAHAQIQPWNRSDPGRYFPWDQVLTHVAERLASVPEPSTALMTLTAVGLAIACRRRR